MVRLLAAQARRRGFDHFWTWTLLSVALFLGPSSLGMLWGGDGASLQVRIFVYIFAFAVAGLVPLGQLGGDAALLASLRRGRCLEEIVGTRTPAAEVVDQVAFYSVFSVLRMGAAVVVPLLLGVLWVVPAEYRLWVLGAAAAWFPGAAFLVLLGSYALQAQAVWTRRGESSLLLAGVLTLAALGLWAGVGAGEEALHRAWDRGAGVLLAAFLLVLGVCARALAIRGLDRACEPTGTRTPVPGTPPTWTPWSSNPIVLREAARHRVPFPALARLGLPGYLLARHGPLWLGAALLVAWQLSPWPPPEFLLYATAFVFLFLQPLFASAHSARSVLAEREGGTLEALAATGLEARTFVDGWALAAGVPRLVEAALALALLALGAVLANPEQALNPREGSLLLLFYLPDYLIRMVLGAYLGIVVSCLAKARRDATMLLVVLWIALGIVLSTGSSVILGFLFFVLTGPRGGEIWALGAYGLVSTGLTLLVVAGVRWLALSQVRLVLGPRGR